MIPSRTGDGGLGNDSIGAKSVQGPSWTGRAPIPKPPGQVQKTNSFVPTSKNQGPQQELSSDLALIFERRRKALQDAEDLEYYGGQPPSPPSENSGSAPRRWSAPSSASSPPTIPEKPNSARSSALTVRFASDLEPASHRSAHAAASADRGRDCSGEDTACGVGGRVVTRAGRAYIKEDGRLFPLAPADSEQPPSPPPPPPPYPPPSAAQPAWEPFRDS
jgi:hypothetical protein